MAIASLVLRLALVLGLVLAVATGVAAASESCCSMSVETLEGMRGSNDKCPGTYSDTGVVTINKCGTCPEGRVLLLR